MKKQETYLYEFNQNNSGGSFDHDPEKGVSIRVYIEAHSAIEANAIAENKLDIYFYGVEDNRDCPCCGNRWHEASESDKIKSKGEIKFYYNDSQKGFVNDNVYTFIHYLDGTFEGISGDTK